MAFNPSNSTRLQNKNYANRIRHGSPKLQEMLREKCRQRMREKRDQLFNRQRFGLEFNSEQIQNTLTEIIRQELKCLDTSDCDDNDAHPDSTIEAGELTQEQALELEHEFIQEQEQWIFQECERLARKEIEYLSMCADDENNEVICPLCQRVALSEINNCVTCAICGLRLAGYNMQEARHLITKRVREHEANCFETPIFTVIPESNVPNLYMVCYVCSTLELVC